MTHCLFKLEFSTPVHFGAGDYAHSVESCRMNFAADTLFSALCNIAVKSGEIDRRLACPSDAFRDEYRRRVVREHPDELVFREFRSVHAEYVRASLLVDRLHLREQLQYLFAVARDRASYYRSHFNLIGFPFLFDRVFHDESSREAGEQISE